MIERDVVLSAMSFFFIHVKTGVIFGFIKDAKNEFRMKLVFYITKAGDGNRTHVSSLEGWCSTIELHPHVSLFFCVPQDKNYNITRLHKMQPLFSNFFNFFNYI